MIRSVIPGKTLYENPEELLNEIIKTINDIHERLEKLTLQVQDNYITNAASFIALGQILNLSTDGVLDFMNAIKKEEKKLRGQLINVCNKSEKNSSTETLKI